MVYALNISATVLAAIVCAGIGVIALIGAIIAGVKIAAYKKANKYDAVTVSETAPVQPKSLSMPERPQLPAPEGSQAEEATVTDDPVTDGDDGIKELVELEQKVEELTALKAEVEEYIGEQNADEAEEPANEPAPAEEVEEPAAETPEEEQVAQTEEVAEVEEVTQTEEAAEEVTAEQPVSEVEEVPAEEATVDETAEQEDTYVQEPEEVTAVEEAVEAEQAEEPVERATQTEEVAEVEEVTQTEEVAEAEQATQTEEIAEVEEAPAVEQTPAAVEEAEEADEAEEESFEEESAQTEIPVTAPRVAPEGKILVKVRYNRSYTARLIQAHEPLKEYYDEIKNELMRYGVSDRISWKHETFRKGRKLLARFAVRGKTLGVYLATDPKDLQDTKYKVEDVSAVKKNVDVPTLYRIKNDRRCRYAKELIAKLMAENGIEAGEEQHEKYSAQYPYEELEPLIDRNLVKLLPWKDFAAGSEVGLIAVSKDNLPTEILMGEVSVAEADDMFVGGSVDVLVENSAKYSDRTKKDIINIDTLGRYFKSGETVTVEEIKKRVPTFAKRATYVKVLARGKLDKALTVEADDFSPEAIKMIVLTGGKVIRKKANN